LPLDFEINATYSFVSLISKFIPSPDWYFKADINLCDEITGEWVDGMTVDGVAYDAGTDSGARYDSPDSPTNPQEPISINANIIDFFGAVEFFKIEKCEASNTEYVLCGAVCPRRCGDQDANNCVDDNNSCVPGCFCKEGFALDENDNCVSLTDQSCNPTLEPTAMPTPEPTPTPTSTPTEEPTPMPTTAMPTDGPTEEPTAMPTEQSTGPPSGGFDFGDDCQAGAGDFDQDLPVRKVLDDVGIIPTGKFEVEVNLRSATDVDVSLFDVDDTDEHPEGKAIVFACTPTEAKNASKNCGLIGDKGEETLMYKDMKITYSGYLGDAANGGSRGDEFIRIEGMTTTRLMMKAYPFRTGNAKIDYSWAEGCGGVFETDVRESAVIEVGLIPTGVRDLRVELEAPEDIDIQLYDTNKTDAYTEGEAIIGFCKTPCNRGPITASGRTSGMHKGLEYVYGGFNGDFDRTAPPNTTSKGNEFIQLNGVTNTNLRMAVFGYKSGTAKVKYTYRD